MPRYRILLVAGLLALTASVCATPAEAAKRKVPFGFFGTVLNNSQVDRISDAALDAQMASMAESGVESVRIAVRWADAEPSRGTYDFSFTDRVVAAAARHRLDVLPIVLHTPRWASTRPSSPTSFLYAPTRPRLYAEFMRVLVGRYGPRGSFWATSGTPKVPIRAWQVWNEPAADFFWATRPWQRSYTRLLRPAYRTVHRADRGATVVLASLAGVTSGTPWQQLRQLYRAGAKGYFDAVSVHFFSAAPSVRLTSSQTLAIARLIRKEMRRARDRRKKVWFTELTWTAAKGKIPRRHLLGFETTPKGQAARLRRIFSRLARARKRLGVGRVYWYNWASEYVPQFAPGGPGSLTFQYSGLNKVDDVNFQPMPLLRVYARTVARFEGCRKSADARRCR
jgi:Beta-galactosidase/Glycosyl hydrolase family 53